MNNADDLCSFLEPFTFFSHFEESDTEIIAYVLTMDKEAQSIMNQVPDKINTKKVKFHFASSLDKAHVQTLYNDSFFVESETEFTDDTEDYCPITDRQVTVFVDQSD